MKPENYFPLIAFFKMFLIYLMFTQGSDLLENLLPFCTWWWPDPGPLFKQTWIFRMRGCCHILLILMVVLTFSKPSDCPLYFFNTRLFYLLNNSSFLLFHLNFYLYQKFYFQKKKKITLLVEITKLQKLNNFKIYFL